MRVELADCENVLLREAADKTITRDSIALTYALAIISSQSDSIDWDKVNAAIIERWSVYGLVYIKKRAWRKVEEKRRESRRREPQS